MNELEEKSVLVICDSGFMNLCQEPFDYMGKLYGVLKKRLGENVKIYTVTGKYGLSLADPTLPVYSVENKNKTAFIQDIENIHNQVDELLILSLISVDQYLEGAAERMASHHKTITRYGYPRKTNEQKP